MVLRKGKFMRGYTNCASWTHSKTRCALGGRCGTPSEEDRVASIGRRQHGADISFQRRAGAKVSMQFTWRSKSTARRFDSRHNALDRVRATSGQAEC